MSTTFGSRNIAVKAPQPGAVLKVSGSCAAAP